MRNFIFLLLFVFAISVLSISAQYTESQSAVCENPVSYKFDEFEFSTIEDIKERLDLFALKLKESKKNVGIIITYEGKQPEGARYRNYDVLEYLTNYHKLRRFKEINLLNGGYREQAEIELFIKPFECSEDPIATPTIEIEDIIFPGENNFLAKAIEIKSPQELSNLITKKTDPPFPPAARAIGAGGKVLILVLIDEHGKVIDAKVAAGHPLLLMGAVQAVKNWEFEKVKKNKKPIIYGGKVFIDFDELLKRLPKMQIDPSLDPISIDIN